MRFCGSNASGHETGLSTNMSGLRSGAPSGDRCRSPVPHGHWKTTTFTGVLRLSGMTAPMVLDGAMNELLVPEEGRGVLKRQKKVKRSTFGCRALVEFWLILTLILIGVECRGSISSEGYSIF